MFGVGKRSRSSGGLELLLGGGRKCVPEGLSSFVLSPPHLPQTNHSGQQIHFSALFPHLDAGVARGSRSKSSDVHGEWRGSLTEHWGLVLGAAVHKATPQSLPEQKTLGHSRAASVWLLHETKTRRMRTVNSLQR